MKKKVVSLLLVGVLAMSTFVGCGSKGSSDAKQRMEVQMTAVQLQCIPQTMRTR